MRARTLRPLLVAAFFAALLLWPASPAQADVTVSIGAGGVSPSRLAVAVGESVTFRNDDAGRHRIRSDGDPPFDTGNLDPGESATVQFPVAGTFAFLDEEDDDDARFHGTITVGSAAEPGAGPASGGTGPGGAVAGRSAVSIVDFGFQPATVQVTVGSTVGWTNNGDARHTVTAEGGAFDSGRLDPRGTFEHAFPAAGRFPYRCDLHPEMQGEVVVSAGAGAPSPTTGAAGQGGEPEPAAEPTGEGDGPGAAVVEVQDFELDPPELTVGEGTEVTWRFTGRATHTVTAEDGSFDSGEKEQGDTFQQTFAAVGRYPYACAIHPRMKGTIVVVAGTDVVPTGSGGGGFALAKWAGIGLVALPLVFLLLAWARWLRPRSP